MKEKIYGYARISTPKQSIERQIRNIIAEYPTANLYQEVYTGAKINRREWNKLYERVREGDTIVFDSVSRMSRDAEDGYRTYEALFSRGVNLVFLKEPLINTDTFRNAMANSVPLTGTDIDFIIEGVNKFLLAVAKEQIRLAFIQSEKEVADLRQRTKEGILTARLKGKNIGRPTGKIYPTKKSIEAKKIIEKHSTTFGGSLKDTEVLALAGISRNSYYKYKKEILERVALDNEREARS